MKNFLLTAVLAASAVMPVMAGTALPYSETFDTAADFATMTVVDANSELIIPTTAAWTTG